MLGFCHMKDLEKILKVLASRRRLAILQYLKKSKEANVGDIAEEIKLSFKATSKHLAVLSAVDIIERAKKFTDVLSVGKQSKTSGKTYLRFALNIFFYLL